MKTISTFLKNFTLTTPLAIIFGSVIISLALIAYGYIVRGAVPTAATTMFAGKVIDSTDYVEGNADSDVVVIEYSDPECPYCLQLHPDMKQIRTEYASKISFVYRHFPLTQIHAHALPESKAIACAGIVGGAQKFYEYIDALFGYKVPKQTAENPSPQLPLTGKEDIARGVGLNIASFTSCMNNQNTDALVSASTDDGVAAGVQGTPSSYVLVKTKKGYEVVAMIDGARPYAYIKAAIEEALSR